MEWISKEAVLRICEEEREDIGDIRTIIAKTRSLPIKVGSGWIDAREQLPEKDEDVLACDATPRRYKKAKPPRIMVGCDPIKQGGQYYLWSNSRWAIFTHWRALPEPPERK